MKKFFMGILLLFCQDIFAMPPIPLLASKMEISAVLSEINNSSVNPMNSISSIQALDNGHYSVIFVGVGNQRCQLEFQISRVAEPDQEADTANPVARKVAPTTSVTLPECQGF